MTRSGSSASVTPVGQLQVLRLDVLADVEVGDVELEVLRDVARQALDVDLAVHEVDHAALDLDTVGRAHSSTGTCDA